MIIFNEKQHTYTNTDTNFVYESVTTFLKRFSKPYDSDFWTDYKATEKVITSINSHEWWSLKKLINEQRSQDDLNSNDELKKKVLKAYIKQSRYKFKIYIVKEQIAENWNKAKNKGCEIGSAIHEYKEVMTLIENEDSIHEKDNNNNKIAKDINKLLRNVWYSEIIVWNDDYGISGTIDKIMLLEDDNSITVIIEDYKTNKKLSVKNPYEKLLFPLDYLESTDLNKYILQLSLYGWLIKQMLVTDKQVVYGRFAIIHIDRVTNVEERLEFDIMEDEVIKMVTHGK